MKLKALIACFLLSSLVVLSACGNSAPFASSPVFSRNFPPPGPPNYQQGMVDGCRTALSAISHSLGGYMNAGIHYDVDKALNDNVYYKAWKDAYFYCKYDKDKGPE